MKVLAFMISFVFLQVQSCNQNNDFKKTLWTAMFSPDGKLIATGGSAGQLNILDATSLKSIKSYSVDSVILARVKWHPTENKLAVITQSNTFKCKILDLDNDQWTELEGLFDSSRAIDWNYDGTLLAISEREDYVCIYKANGELVSRFRGDEKGVLSISWHPTKNELVTVGSQIGIYNVEGDTLHSFLPNEKEVMMLCVQWHPSGDFFAVGDYGELTDAENKSLMFWKADGTNLHQNVGSLGEYRNIRWSPDGSMLAAVTDKLIILDKNGRVLSESESSEDFLWGVDWSPDGTKIVTSSKRGILTLWTKEAIQLKSVKL